MYDRPGRLKKCKQTRELISQTHVLSNQNIPTPFGPPPNFGDKTEPVLLCSSVDIFYKDFKLDLGLIIVFYGAL